MNILTSKISRKHLSTIIASYASDETTLEVGSYGKPSYGNFFPNRIGIDIRPGPGVDRIASVYELPFPDSHFQNVLCMSVLEHLEDPARAITEMHRTLKPGGRIIISVPFLFPLHDSPSDYWRFTPYGLRHLFREGWQIEHVQGETNAQQSLAVLLQRLAYQSRPNLNVVAKVLLFSFAKILDILPNLFSKVYGDIHKKAPEPYAFSSALFFVASKK